jgi:hypothetical protein
MSDTHVAKREVLFVVEGQRKPRSFFISPETRASEFLGLVRKELGRDDLVELLLEDEDEPLAEDVIILDCVNQDAFKLVHVATPGTIAVTVIFNAKPKERAFRASTTMERIVRWAIEAFELQGDPSDFQLKLGDDLLPAGEHLGQVADGKKHVKLSLVMKIKPQG